ncbi:hypothetical protein [Aliarcobacter butzleri]|uniref:hypothetical protein n=1 Tax=Aliarcobacter butzleri TaxID=28197 RepID=UPI002B253171|nr:hypothetical protein [Aliarcobacter butzleri]
MDLLTKECEVCGTKISKVRKWYRLIFINEIKCSNCGSRYRLSKWFEWGFELLNLGHFIGIVLIVIILDKIFDNLGGEVWLISIMIYIIIKFLIALITQLKLIKSKKELENEQK